MSNNKYYLIDIPNENMTHIYGIIIGRDIDQCKSLDNKKMIIKLPEGDNNNHPFLNKYTSMTHSEIIPIKRSSEFTGNI